MCKRKKKKTNVKLLYTKNDWCVSLSFCLVLCRPDQNTSKVGIHNYPA